MGDDEENLKFPIHCFKIEYEKTFVLHSIRDVKSLVEITNSTWFQVVSLKQKYFPCSRDLLSFSHLLITRLYYVITSVCLNHVRFYFFSPSFTCITCLSGCRKERNFSFDVSFCSCCCCSVNSVGWISPPNLFFGGKFKNKRRWKEMKSNQKHDCFLPIDSTLSFSRIQDPRKFSRTQIKFKFPPITP